ncbi:ABC transporter permease [Conexibacter sp. SYSU D00693]|uniref:MlaE family ABC transporter permease n=1 Tax=Conexibacter sp. SYSU D00693 TaxID=2812560 RepID=UPI00196B2BE4|nr:ABC transporter permease [Conexibacter sp. SYSU D00693]
MPIARLGGMLSLSGSVLRALSGSPAVWRRELLLHCVFILKVAALPIALSVAAWGFAGPGLQAGGFLATFGSVDRAGGFMVVAIVREFGTFVTGTVVAGVVGTTIVAELGARRVRGELDALRTLGVDPVAAIVAPRVLALVLMMMLLDVVALVFGVAGGYVASVGVLDGGSGAFVDSFFRNTTALDLVASIVKVGIFGALIGVICGFYGLTATGGAEGVGRAVNRAVVGCLVAISVVNLLYTQWFLAEFPGVNVLR